jgi:ubiquitin carboxyl-terminal hydrolase 35/38
MKQYLKDITNVVGNLLSYIWRDSDKAVIVKSLEQIFSIISHVNESKSPSLALAGIVPNIPIEYVNSIVKQTVSDPNIADENIKEALTRMIDWLTWPGAKNLDTWIIAFFRGLASVHKYTILMEVTETKIEHVSYVCFYLNNLIKSP